MNEVTMDANNMTKSGSLTPAVDFGHLSTVLVITDLKQQVDTEQTAEEETVPEHSVDAESGDDADGAGDGDAEAEPDEGGEQTE